MIDSIAFSRTVDSIIKTYNLKNNDKTRDVIENFILACSERKVEINDKIWDMKLINHVAKYKMSRKLYVLLNLLWQRPCSTSRLSQLSDQHAAQIRVLRQNGFVFKKTKHSNGVCYDFRILGQRMREIVGIAKPITTSNSIPTKIYTLFVTGQRCSYTGSENNLEVDHRQPVSACIKLGIDPVLLTKELIEKGEADKHFQCISKTWNSIKKRSL